MGIQRAAIPVYGKRFSGNCGWWHVAGLTDCRHLVIARLLPTHCGPMTKTMPILVSWRKQSSLRLPRPPTAGSEAPVARKATVSQAPEDASSRNAHAIALFSQCAKRSNLRTHSRTSKAPFFHREDSLSASATSAGESFLAMRSRFRDAK
jgi:hypothetical protein